MTTRYACPRTCRRCGTNYTVFGNKQSAAPKTGICDRCRIFKGRSDTPTQRVPVPDLSAGACHNSFTDLWFSTENPTMTAAAVEICRRCPIRDACLQYALDADEQFGIWGGLDVRQRARIKARKAAS